MRVLTLEYFMKKKTLALLCVVTCSVMPMAASAYDYGNWILQLGATTVSPDDESGPIDQNSALSVSAHDNTQLVYRQRICLRQIGGWKYWRPRHVRMI